MSKKLWNVAVVGATGAVGTTMLTVLNERNFPIQNLYALASERSVGKTVAFGKKQIEVHNLDKFDFKDADIALFSAGGSISEKYVPRATDAGCVVVDNTSHYRYDDDIPLIVPEVNPEALSQYTKRKIIANPNCSTIQMLVALKPLHDCFEIERINVATYQSVSGTGTPAIEELLAQSREILEGKSPASTVYPQPIAFNILPQIDTFQDNGYTREEMKMVWETQKILSPDIKVNPTTARVPVVYGHSEAVHIECAKEIDVDRARDVLKNAPGVTVIDEHKDGAYPTALVHGAGKDDVFVGRLRADISHPRGLDLWVVSDNLRKGAATNSVQIAELLIASYLQ